MVDADSAAAVAAAEDVIAAAAVAAAAVISVGKLETNERKGTELSVPFFMCCALLSSS